jgi:hypothetical protein
MQQIGLISLTWCRLELLGVVGMLAGDVINEDGQMQRNRAVYAMKIEAVGRILLRYDEDTQNMNERSTREAEELWLWRWLTSQ